MKLYYVSRGDLFTTPGGDSIQIKKLQSGMQSRGVSTSIISRKDLDNNVDAMHIFNLTRLSDAYAAAMFCQSNQIPYIVTPIWHSLDDMANFYFPRTPKPLRRLAISSYLMAKELYYEWKSGDLKTPLKIILNGGYIQACNTIIAHSLQIQANSEGELQTIERELNINIPSHRKKVVRLGVEPPTNTPPASCKTNDIVLAGRIEPRKNTNNTIRSFLRSKAATEGATLYVAGAINDKHSSYTKTFFRLIAESGSSVKYLGKITQEELFAFYKSGATCLLASYFETVGLTALEALCVGGKAVVTSCTYPDYYFDDFVTYCDPYNPDDISKAIDNESRKDPRYPKERAKSLSWNSSCQATIDAYAELLCFQS